MGSAPISWIGGLARQLPGVQGVSEGTLGVNQSCFCCAVDRPGRLVRMSAPRPTCAGVIPYTFSSCGVAT